MMLKPVSVNYPYYLTGRTALNLPDKSGRPTPLWYSSQIPLADRWCIGGMNFSTSHQFFGDNHLWDGAAAIARYGVSVEGEIWVASYERALFDILYHYCEIKLCPVTNIQAQDIDDVVDFSEVKAWILQLSDVLSHTGRTNMISWLDGRPPN